MTDASVARAPRFKNFELIAGGVLTAIIVIAVLLSRVLFPDSGDAVNFMARMMPPSSAGASLRHRPARQGRAGPGRCRRTHLAAGRRSFGGRRRRARTAVGLVSGYYRGFWDTLVMRFADIQLALPFILLAITFIAIIGGGLTT